MVYEAKFTPLEKERPDAMEVAAKAHEKREAPTPQQVVLAALLIHLLVLALARI